MPPEWLPEQHFGRRSSYPRTEALSSFGGLLNYDAYLNETVDGMMFSAAHFMMCEPTGVEPVKAILAMRLLVASASAASRSSVTGLPGAQSSSSPVRSERHGRIHSTGR